MKQESHSGNLTQRNNTKGGGSRVGGLNEQRYR